MIDTLSGGSDTPNPVTNPHPPLPGGGVPAPPVTMISIRPHRRRRPGPRRPVAPPTPAPTAGPPPAGHPHPHPPAGPNRNAPWDPIGSPMMSLAQMEALAKQWAKDDITKALAGIRDPTRVATDMQNITQGTVGLINQNNAPVINAFSHLGDTYNQATATQMQNSGASQAAVAAGGAAPVTNTGQGNLVQALANSTSGFLTSQANIAAVAGGQAQAQAVQHVADQRAAVLAGQPQAFDAYMRSLRQEAFQISAAKAQERTTLQQEYVQMKIAGMKDAEIQARLAQQQNQFDATLGLRQQAQNSTDAFRQAELGQGDRRLQLESQRLKQQHAQFEQSLRQQAAAAGIRLRDKQHANVNQALHQAYSFVNQQRALYDTAPSSSSQSQPRYRWTYTIQVPADPHALPGTPNAGPHVVHITAVAATRHEADVWANQQRNSFYPNGSFGGAAPVQGTMVSGPSSSTPGARTRRYSDADIFNAVVSMLTSYGLSLARARAAMSQYMQFYGTPPRPGHP